MIIYWQKRCTRFCRGWTGCSLAAAARAIMSRSRVIVPSPACSLHHPRYTWLNTWQPVSLQFSSLSSLLRPDISTFAFASYEVILGIKIITKGGHTREHEDTVAAVETSF